MALTRGHSLTSFDIMQAKRSQAYADTTAAVDDFVAALSSDVKNEVQAIRHTILGVAPQIAEGVKWNAPSFRTTEYFATTHLRGKNGIAIIFHLGAKVREANPEGIRIDDEMALLRWLAKDRAIIRFQNLQDFNAKRLALVEIVNQWIRYV